MVSLPRARQRLHTMPTSTGYEIETDPSYNWDGRRRGQTRHGTPVHHKRLGNLRWARSYRIEPGEMMLLVVPHAHRYWVEKGGRWEFFWISMHGAEALQIHKEVLAAKPSCPQAAGSDPLDHLADCACRLM